MRMFVARVMVLGWACVGLEATAHAKTPVPSPQATAAVASPSPATTPSTKSTAVSTPQPSKTTTPETSSAKSTSATASAKSATTTATATTSPAPTSPHRYPVLAGVLSVIPGIAIHGAGHMYAGSWMKGVGLFLLEGASTYLMYDGYNRYQRGDFNNVLKAGGNNASGGGNQIPTNLGIEYQEAGVALVGGVGWLFTWFADWSAPDAAREFNQVHQLPSQTTLNLMPRPGGAVLALNRTF